MVAHHYISFDNAMPDLDVLLKRMSAIANEDIFLDERIMVLYSPAINGVVHLDASEKNSYIVTVFGRNINYLTGVCIFALVSLGGRIPVILPDWVNKPWNKTKFFFIFKSKKVIYV